MFKLLHDADLNLGQDVEVKLKAKNNNKKYSRTVKAVTFNFQRRKYTGEIVKLVKSEKCEGEKELKPGQGGWITHKDNTPYTLILYNKTGVNRGNIIFLNFALRYKLWVLVRSASLSPPH